MYLILIFIIDNFYYLFNILLFLFFKPKNNFFFDLGVNVFVDYKIENEHYVSSFSPSLIKMGAKVEKTFNRKVNVMISY
jgi:hypothetical protein